MLKIGEIKFAYYIVSLKSEILFDGIHIPDDIRSMTLHWIWYVFPQLKGLGHSVQDVGEILVG